MLDHPDGLVLQSEFPEVEVVHRDSSDAGEKKLEKSFAELVDKGVDVIIGPSTSVLTLRILELAEEAGIPIIPPAATSPQLTTYDTSMRLPPAVVLPPSATLIGVAKVFERKTKLDISGDKRAVWVHLAEQPFWPSVCHIQYLQCLCFTHVPLALGLHS